jgi:hypothetical protein
MLFEVFSITAAYITFSGVIIKIAKCYIPNLKRKGEYIELSGTDEQYD